MTGASFMKNIFTLICVLCICFFFSCQKDFHHRATERFAFFMDSIRNDDSLHKYIEQAVVYESDSIYVRRFDIKWKLYGREASNTWFYIYGLDNKGRDLEMYKRDGWFYDKLVIDDYMAKLDDKRALGEAMYRICCVIGKEIK